MQGQGNQPQLKLSLFGAGINAPSSERLVLSPNNRMTLLHLRLDIAAQYASCVKGPRHILELIEG